MTSIDPRLRQRRIAVRRAEGRRRLRLLLVVLGLLAATAGAYGITRSALLDLDRIEVQGVDGVEADEVRAASGLEVGTPLLDLDLGSATEAVVSLPWVRSARVERSWPGSVNVAVESRSVVAVLALGDGGVASVDEEGVAIALGERATLDDQPLIVVDGSAELGEVKPGEVQTVALPAIGLVLATPGDLAAWVQSYAVEYVSVEPHLRLELVGGAVAELGDPSNLSAKLEGVRSVIDQVDRRCLALIDATVGGIPTVRRDAECEALRSGDQ